MVGRGVTPPGLMSLPGAGFFASHGPSVTRGRTVTQE